MKGTQVHIFDSGTGVRRNRGGLPIQGELGSRILYRRLPANTHARTLETMSRGGVIENLGEYEDCQKLEVQCLCGRGTDLVSRKILLYGEPIPLCDDFCGVRAANPDRVKRQGNKKQSVRDALDRVKPGWREENLAKNSTRRNPIPKSKRDKK